MHFSPEQFVQQVTELHRETVDRWHHESIDNQQEGLLAIVCRQHQFNFLLWHEEDVARSPDVSDGRIAEVKRKIDRYNQQRNDWIEKIDVALQNEVAVQGVKPPATASLNTETPGSAIDRLSILALRIYHMREQLERADVDPDHHAKVRSKLDLCYAQHLDLSGALVELLADIFAGRKRLRLYRQMKMYNDASLNPYLYNKQRKVA